MTTKRYTATIKTTRSLSNPVSLNTGPPLPIAEAEPSTLPEILRRAASVAERGVRHLVADGVESFETYEELLAQAESVLSGLRALGLKPGDQVIFQLEQSADFLAAFWGCALGGIVPVPLSIAPTYLVPNGALTKLQNAWQMLDRPVILCGETLQGPITDLGQGWEQPAPRVVTIESLRGLERDSDWHACRPEDLALLLLTSGSTGMPKSVMLTHGNVLARSRGTALLNSHNKSDVSLNWFPLDHVGGIVMFHIRDVMLTCDQIHAPIQRVIENPLLWLEWIEQYRVTVTWAPNFAYGLINDRADEVNSRPRDLSSLGFILNAGEAIVARTARRFMSLLEPHGLPATAMHPAWGMSETSSAFTYSDRFTLPTTSDDDSFVSVGVPIMGANVRLVDADDKCVSEGVIGRLQVTGPSVTGGYFRNPEVNQESFTADGWFKTGDLGVMVDGQLSITGREKDVIIINGINYHGHEIESIVEDVEGIEPSFTAATAVRPPASDTDQLAVFFHTERTDPEALGELLKTVRSQIISSIGLNPSYLLPVDKEDIPKTAIGKIQRAQLRKRLESGDFTALLESLAAARSGASGAGPVAPRSEEEERVAAIWAEVLKLERVSVHDSYFELGGDSLLATRIITRMRSAFGVPVTLQHLFEGPTVAEMTASIGRLHGAGDTPGGDAPVIPALPRTLGNDTFALSSAQQRLWFLEQWEPANPAYIQLFDFRLTGDVHPDLLQQSLDAMVARHEALRTTFILVDGQSRQKIHAEMAVPVQIIDMGALHKTGLEAAVKERIREESRAPFDLQLGPPVRAVLLQTGMGTDHFLVTMHHLITDAWSLNLFMQEFADIYNARARGVEPSLPDIPIQYADYGVWQHEWVRGETVQKQVDYWKERLGNDPPTLELRTDYSRPAQQTYTGAKRSLVLPTDLANELKAFSQHESVTPFMVTLATFFTMLHRYTGQEDILVGVPISNRHYMETEGILGYLTNTLVLRASLAGDRTFRETLRHVREIVLEAQANQDVPFEMIVDEVHPKRDMSRTPLFQVMFQNIALPSASVALGDGALQYHEYDNGTAKFDLTMQVAEMAEGMVCTCEYNTALFKEETVARLQGHYEALLQGILADPDRALCQLPLLTAHEEAEIELWSGVSNPFEPNGNLAQAVEQWAEKTPDATAVACSGDRLTYRELNAQANQLAHVLKERGVGPEVCVAVCVERSLTMMVALLGILKAGGAYVPIDPAYPDGRIAAMLETIEKPLVLSQERFRKRLERQEAQVICLDSVEDRLASFDTGNLPVAAAADNLAYVIFTSGSTGKPKGVQITHRSVMHLVDRTREPFRFVPSDVWTVFHSYAFDFSVWEIWSPLTSGGTLVIVPMEALQSTQELLALAAREGVTVLNLTPSVLRALAETLPPEGPRSVLPKLRLLISGGEALPGDLARRLLSWDIPLWNFYGPTEATVWATARHVQEPDADDAMVTVGQHLPNMQVRILDGRLQAVPVGIPGELHIGGVGLARGYRSLPELTAERFVPDPFDPTGNGRLYKTGDLGAYRPDGSIEYLGRIDHQIKLRGYRIELGEIEATLNRHPEVRESVVVYREANGSASLVAYVVPAGAVALEAGMLRAFLQKSLPDYMVPSTFVVLESLPLNNNGKVDRHALPAPERTGDAGGAAFEQPRELLQIRLQKLWEAVLDVRPIGIRDDFFDLGGNSLVAIRLLAQVEKSFDRRLPLAVLFQAPTIEQMAEALTQDGCSLAYASLVPIQPSGTLPILFCVHGAGGEVLFYKDLARHLGKDQPIYGLQARVWDPAFPQFNTVEERAAHYIAEIKSVQVSGPYRLCGASLGGIIAFEMARQLEAAGDEVAFLGMFDGFHPEYMRFRPRVTRLHRIAFGIYRTVEHHVGSIRLLGRGKRLPYAREKAYRAAKETQWFFEDRWKEIVRIQRRRKGEAPPTESVKKVHPLRASTSRYVASAYGGPMTIFRAMKQPLGIYQSRTLGWAEFVKSEIEVIDVPGYHAAIIVEPRVRFVAGPLRECLMRAPVNIAAKATGEPADGES